MYRQGLFIGVCSGFLVNLFANPNFMKNLLATLLLFTVVTAFAPQPLQYVYIDQDPKATLYHADKNCKELDKKGHHKIIKVTLDEAINKYKRQPCPLCCKKQ